ncbi:type II toxin-antitoxin system RelE/ParE family toxin [Persicimonas caeni]|uniref:Type II toxin-antitoxin system RelE/ParE family toxin n=1 Tax=Persicimonas caeni TaxID=2292766 RepID=A0A4Y6PZ70_PERCE|nr:type II toxin-antitoxin system RelE/ParE family toxin [Persicimonas caeni]QDG53469.1 type II toxin-antitoxin system RelE/ParE family toxin [Persicimonas caeni]QED34690.1 type II toxin-antitoxin system RelE/ParE family toxin [Persicimonas caeni]
MTLDLNISPAAEHDLIDIWAFIASDNPNAADDFVDALHSRCFALTHTPRMGRCRDDLVRGLRSFPFRNYVIFYRIAETSVDVVRVLSGLRNIRPSLF